MSETSQLRAQTSEERLLKAEVSFQWAAGNPDSAVSSAWLAHWITILLWKWMHRGVTLLISAVGRILLWPYPRNVSVCFAFLKILFDLTEFCNWILSMIRLNKVYSGLLVMPSFLLLSLQILRCIENRFEIIRSRTWATSRENGEKQTLQVQRQTLGCSLTPLVFVVTQVGAVLSTIHERSLAEMIITCRWGQVGWPEVSTFHSLMPACPSLTLVSQE